MCSHSCHKLALRHKDSYVHLASFLELQACPAATQQAGLCARSTADGQTFTKEAPALIPHLGRRVCWMLSMNQWAVNSLLSICNNASLMHAH